MLYDLIVIFGLFFIVVVPAIVGRALSLKSERGIKTKNKRSESMECVVCGKENVGKKFCGYCGGELVSASQSEVMPLPDEKTRGTLHKMIGWIYKEFRSTRGFIALGIILLILIGFDLTPWKLATLAVGLLLAIFSILSLASKSDSKEMIFVTLLALIAFLLIAGCEVLFIKDHFSDGSLYRMNTVFKFHYQVWYFSKFSQRAIFKMDRGNPMAPMGSLEKVSLAYICRINFLCGGHVSTDVIPLQNEPDFT